MGFWHQISNLGVEQADLSDWEKRNLRFMNSMTFILACAMVFLLLWEQLLIF